MKKPILSIFMLWCFSFAYSQTTNPLLNDQQLASLITKMNSVSEIIHKSTNGDRGAINTLETNINELNSNLTDQEYNTEFGKFLNLPLNYDFVTDLKDIKSEILILKNRFGNDFNQNNIEAAVTEIYKLAPPPSSSPVDADPCKHSWRYALCVAE